MEISFLENIYLRIKQSLSGTAEFAQYVSQFFMTLCISIFAFVVLSWFYLDLGYAADTEVSEDISY